MKEKLAQLNNTQFEIQTLENQIQKIEAQFSSASKAKKDFYESVLKGFRVQLSILKKKK